ncbi:MAG: YfiR family protein [Bryobacteraceae bacterium]
MGLAQQPLELIGCIGQRTRIVPGVALRRFLSIGTILAALLIGQGELRCGEAGEPKDQTLEYRVKAAFLLNFTKFTEWPEVAFGDAKSPLSICILGTDPFGHILDQTLEGEVVNSRRVVVERIQSAPPLKACQVLFVGKPEDVAKTLATVGPNVLTVSEDEAFIRGGGMIYFLIEGGRVRFDINQTVAETAGLKLSSKLLKVARQVHGKPLEQ